MSADRLAASATATYRASGVHSLSVWAVDDSTAADIVRLARDASPTFLAHGQIRTSTVGVLSAYGYELAASEPDGHYSLLLPDPPTDVDWSQLDSAFSAPEPNPV